MIKLLSILLAFISVSILAKSDQDCYETAMTQTAMNICAGSKNKEASLLLEGLINELKQVLPEKPEAHLISSQEAWLKVVENDCSIESWYVDGGSARPMIVAGCYAQHSKQRIKMLAPLLCHPMLSTCNAKEKYEKNL
jgi:uncharacterized protein YecT (DUF1311 family)